MGRIMNVATTKMFQMKQIKFKKIREFTSNLLSLLGYIYENNQSILGKT
jgi:hypothetical protein